MSTAIVESKLLLLYLLEKMNLPMSTSQISEFVLEEGMLNFFELQQCLHEMTESKYLDMAKENNNTRYSVTDNGMGLLELFEKRVPMNVRNKIIKYVNENRANIKRAFETTANYFKDNQTSEYVVKCGIYEDDFMLMEVNLTVVSREQARDICDNWKNNVSQIYGKMLGNLMTQSPSPSTKPKKSAISELNVLELNNDNVGTA